MKSVHLVSRLSYYLFTFGLFGSILIPVQLFSTNTVPESGKSSPLTVSAHLKPVSDSLKIEEFAKTAFYYYDFLGDKHSADSVSQLAIQFAESSYQHGLLLLSYIRYLENNDISMYLSKSLEYARDAQRLS